MLALTGQPQREGKGDRWAALQYAMPGDQEHLLFVFRLDGSEPGRTVRLGRLDGFDPAARFVVRSLASGAEECRTATELARDGLAFDDLGEEDSDLLRITALDPRP